MGPPVRWVVGVVRHPLKGRIFWVRTGRCGTGKRSPMRERSVAIIGAGLGGLAAGCYGQLRGLRTTVFEMHDRPGGFCTAWTRKGYTFDGCIHHLAGCLPGTATYRIWEELGAMPREVLFPDDLTQVETPAGAVFTVHTDLDRLEAHMRELAPEDTPLIRRYVRALRTFTRFDIFDAMAGSWRDRAGLAYAAPFGPMSMMRARPMSVPGSEGLQIVGQSVGGAGIPGCAVMGRNAIAALT